MVIITNIVAFIILLSIVVFVHEFGHYIVARLNNVQVDEFAIGYGKEIFGKTDKNGTRWKLCLFPFGGFCKFFGDEEASSSVVDDNKLNQLSKEDKEKCLFFKNPWQRIAVVIAGPLSNYLLAIIVFFFFFLSYGKMNVTTKISLIEKNSPAEISGMLANDEILEINGDKMASFEEIKMKILVNLDKEMNFLIKRDNNKINLKIKPIIKKRKDIFNNEVKTPVIGISGNDIQFLKLGIFSALTESFVQTWSITKNTLIVIGQMLAGRRGLDGIGGPIAIAKYSGSALKAGLGHFIFFIGTISLSLGLMNLLPIPVLDGGHILFSLIEIIIGRKVNEKVENIFYKIGFSLLTLVILFSVFKDIIGLFR